MAGAMVDVSGNGTSLPAYLSVPPSGRGPGVVVIHEWWGLVPHIKHVANRLAAEGFVALAPDLYHGVSAANEEPDEARKLVMSMTLDEATHDLGAAVEYLPGQESVEGQRVGALGFGMGGGLSLTLASLRPEVAAAVAFYGVPPQWEPSAIKGAVLGHYAEHDEVTARLPEMEEALRRAGVDVTIHRYPGTLHGFFNNERSQTYNAEAAALAWERTLTFLRARLG